VVFCGGGTGGHVYPALAVASELARRDAPPEMLYVGAEGEIEEKLVPQAGVPLETITGGGYTASGRCALRATCGG